MTTQDPIGTRYRNGSVDSSANGETRRKVTRFTGDKGGLNVQGTNISFTAPATISGTGFPTIAPGQMISVIGSTLNSTSYEVVTSNSTTITVIPALIQTESSGPFIDIRVV